MKTKFIFFLSLIFIHCYCSAQYIGVKARYSETRLVDDFPNPPKRENRLILSFYEVTGVSVYTPISLSNYDIWIEKQGLQYGSLIGGVLDSSGNNYPNYPWTAPKVVSYYNSYVGNYIDCGPSATTHYVVNGHELDCGFITVSYWDVDNGTGNPYEAFPAPNVCLPYYQFPHPYAALPGNVNFEWPILPGPPYNFYNFSCMGSPLQLVIRGVIPQGGGNFEIPLPVLFSNVSGEIVSSDSTMVSWSNLSESNIHQYEIESSADGSAFLSSGIVPAAGNNGNRVDYRFSISSLAYKTYYRIKAIENDGAFFYSKVINVSKPLVVSSESFSVYPNPVTSDQVTLKLRNVEPGRYIFFILTSQGLHVKQKMIEHNGGDLVRQIEMNGLTPGSYEVILQSNFKKYSQRIIYVN